MTDENKDTTDLTTLGTIEGVAERPKSLEQSHAGTEDIDTSQIRLPRLAIAQGLSPQITPGDPQFIEGLTLFQMFNDLTGEVYGRGPITFVPLRQDVRRIEFRPRTEGGGILDMDVPPHDERLKWTVADGQRQPPRATTFVEFVALLLRPNRQPEPIVVSVKTTNKWNRRAADQLTTFVMVRNAAIYSGLYKVDTLTPAKNDQGTFGVYIFKNGGFIPTDTAAGKALYAYAKKFHEDLKGKQINVEREAPSDGADFDAEAMERAPAPAEDRTDAVGM